MWFCRDFHGSDAFGSFSLFGSIVSSDDLSVQRLDALVLLLQSHLLLVLQIIGSLLLRQVPLHESLGILDGALSLVVTVDFLFVVDVEERSSSKNTGSGEGHL